MLDHNGVKLALAIVGLLVVGWIILAVTGSLGNPADKLQIHHQESGR